MTALGSQQTSTATGEKDLEGMRKAVFLARVRLRGSPPMDEVNRLSKDMEAILKRLLPRAERHINRLDKGSHEWDIAATSLSLARDQLKEQNWTGPTARLHCLARSAESTLDLLDPRP